MTLERSTILGPFPLPAVDDELRARARELAGWARWLTFEDPAAQTGQPVPATAVQGGYEVDDRGELTGRYKINPSYHPSEMVSGIPLETTADLKLWRVLHGYSPLGFLVDTLDRAELALYSAQPGDRRIRFSRDDEGHPALTAYTGPRLLPPEWANYHTVPGWTLFERMADSPVYLNLNPRTPLAFKVMLRDLATLLIETTRQERNQGAIPFGA